jgi:hypothetical protein
MTDEERVIARLLSDHKALRDLVDWQAAENKRLREALREIGKKLSPEKYDNEVCLETYCGELARAALGEGKE